MRREGVPRLTIFFIAGLAHSSYLYLRLITMTQVAGVTRFLVVISSWILPHWFPHKDFSGPGSSF